MLTWLYKLADRVRHQARSKRWAQDLAIGRRGEDIAHRYLQAKGYSVVHRNYKTPGAKAEADLVAWDGDTLVIIEVKTRTSEQYGPPERNINRVKELKVITAGEHYARRVDVPQERLRFDAISIVLLGETIKVEHFPGSIRPKRNQFAIAGR